MKRFLIGTCAVLALTACVPTDDASDGKPPPPSKTTVMGLSAEPGYQRLRKMRDADAFAQFGVAGHIMQRCDALVHNQVAIDHIKGRTASTMLFSGKDKVAASFARAEANFQKKYGKPLQSDTSHCDVARQELAEASPVSMFFYFE